MHLHHLAPEAANGQPTAHANRGAPPLSSASRQPSFASLMSRGICGVLVLALLAVGMSVGVAPCWVSTLGTRGFVRTPSIDVDERLTMWTSSEGFGVDNFVEFMVEDAGGSGSGWIKRR